MHIKKGDNVIVTTGADKGKSGTVSRVFRKDSKVLIDGLNVKHKHQKGRRQGQRGQVIDRALPMHVSNVAILDPKDKKATRVGYEVKDGKKVRTTKKSKTALS